MAIHRSQEAVRRGRADAVTVLLRYKADPNGVRPSDGRGPLHEACIQGHAQLIPVLVQAGANPTLEDRSGQTPLDLALDYGNLDAATALYQLTAANPALQSEFRIRYGIGCGPRPHRSRGSSARCWVPSNPGYTRWVALSK